MVYMGVTVVDLKTLTDRWKKELFSKHPTDVEFNARIKNMLSKLFLSDGSRTFLAIPWAKS